MRNRFQFLSLTTIVLFCSALGAADDQTIDEDDWRYGMCSGFHLTMARIQPSGVMPNVAVPFYTHEKKKSRIFTNKIDLHEYLKVKAVTDPKYDEAFEPVAILPLKEALKEGKLDITKDAREHLRKTLNEDDLVFKVQIKKSGKVIKPRLIIVGLRKIERGFLKGKDTPKVVGVWDP